MNDIRFEILLENFFVNASNDACDLYADDLTSIGQNSRTENNS